MILARYICPEDAERSKDFYCRVLGFQVLPRPAFSSGGYWLGTPGIFPQIHIIPAEMEPPGPGAPLSPRGRHTCFEVADYDAMKATLEREGIKYVENTQPGGWGMSSTTSTRTPSRRETHARAGGGQPQAHTLATYAWNPAANARSRSVPCA